MVALFPAGDGPRELSARWDGQGQSSSPEVARWAPKVVGVHNPGGPDLPGGQRHSEPGVSERMAGEDGLVLGPRFDEALVLASELHRKQSKKGTLAPYVAHLLGVCSIVLENGGDEDEAIAALLHDAAEDQGGQATLDLIKARFGERVAGIVAGCSDTFELPKPPAMERKRAYLAHLDDDRTTRSVLLVSAADKVYNLRSTLEDYEAVGKDLWGRFKLKPAEQLWYYRSLAEVYSCRLGGPVAKTLVELVARLAVVVGQEETTEAG